MSARQGSALVVGESLLQCKLLVILNTYHPRRVFFFNPMMQALLCPHYVMRTKSWEWMFSWHLLVWKSCEYSCRKYDLIVMLLQSYWWQHLHVKCFTCQNVESSENTHTHNTHTQVKMQVSILGYRGGGTKLHAVVRGCFFSNLI